MYKRFMVLIVFVIFGFGGIIEPIYAKEENGNSSSDILFIYDKGASKDGEKNIDSISNILVNLGYSVSCSNIEEATDNLKSFSHIIIYNEKKTIDNNFIKELGDSGNKFMVVGGGAVKKIIENLNIPVSCENITDYSANITYAISKQKDINMSVGIQNTNLLKGAFDYTSGKIDIKNTNGFYCTRIGNFTNIAMYNQNNNLLKATLAKEIRFWMQPDKYEENYYKQYIVFDEIYPFMNPDKMLKIVEMMKEYKLPYIISVMPIYNNADYPSMKKFSEILTYAQANEGAIILHYPIIQADKMNKEEIKDKISKAFFSYSEYGVYPIGFEAPHNWVYDEAGLEIMKEFKTVILNESEEFKVMNKEANKLISLKDHNIIGTALDIGNNSFNYIQSYPSAIHLDSNKDIEELKEEMKFLKETNIKISSVWDSAQSINTDKEILKYENNILEVQGKEVSLKYTTFQYEKEFNYNRSAISNMMGIMEKSNRVLLLIVIVTTIIFISFIILARYRNYKRFFYDDDSKSK